MYFGVDYYPEHWPMERWSMDAKLMSQAHINVVRMAEFAWSKVEPEEGVYNFSWLDRAIQVLAEQGIKVILGTPTATPPKWLMDKHPDLYPVDMYGITKGFGTRRHYCPNHPAYRSISKDIALRLVEHYQDSEHIVAWQVDNEFGSQCYCQNCLKAFRKWLQSKYGSIDILNEEWGTVFWSQTYRSFEDIILPTYSASDGFSQNGGSSQLLSTPYNHNPGMLLDFFRFSSDSFVDYQQLQINEIRKKSSLPITHNLMGHYSEIDYFELARNLDVVSWDNYPNNMWGKTDYNDTTMAHSLMRGIKNRNFWMMEQQSGPCGWHAMGDTPEPGQLRLWTYQAIAHGAEAMVYFRWRACTFGIEQYWHGILDHDGIGRRRYREIEQIGRELERCSELFVGAQHDSQVAIVKSYDHFWSHRAQPHNTKFNYNELLSTYFKSLASNHIEADVIGKDAEFDQYKLILLPAFHLMTQQLAAKCEEYVRKGGKLILTFRSGTRTWNNQMTTMTVPGYFRNLAGVELEEFDSVNFGRTVNVTGEFGSGTASMWCDVLKCTTSKPMAVYDSHYYKGTPAVTVNQYGDGTVYYVGCDLDQDAMNRLMNLITDSEGLNRTLKQSITGVEVVVKTSSSGELYTMLLNYNATPVVVPMQGCFMDVLNQIKVEGSVHLEPYGVSILL